MPYSFVTYDVFTDRRYAGNPLAIVNDADDLSTAQMQTIAKEFNLSETIFVMAPKDPANTASVRIFFPTAEIPFAGHPTLGCAVYLAETRGLEHVVLEEVAGLVPVEMERRGGQLFGTFDAPVLPEATGRRIEPRLAASALGLAPAQVGFGGHAPAEWTGGPTFVFAPVADTEALAAATYREPDFTDLVGGESSTGVYVYTPGPDGIDFEARMLAPTGGIPEDPATGSATAILAAQLNAAGALSTDVTRLRLRQGFHMGRPSDLDLTIHRTGETLTRIRVGGTAVPMMSGELIAP